MISKEKGGVAFLRDGGVMGELIRSRDWSNTRLGDPAQWPQALQISISIILNSQFPMFIWWGPDYVTFYNDAYRVILGDKHPQALGASGPQVWEEIWDVVGPMAHRVRKEGRSNWAEDQLLYINRHGRVEETYFTFSYSPVLDSDGTIGGVFCACSETTEKVVTTRKLKESEARFRNIADESPILVFIIENDPQAHVSYWNQTWLQYTGQTEEEAIGKAWNGFIHPDDLPVVMQHYTPAYQNREPYYIPAIRVKRFDGNYRWHSFIGNPRYLSIGEFDGYVGVGFDIHEQKLSEEALRQSETRTRLAAETAQLGTFEVNTQTQEMVYSSRAAEIFGLRPSDQWTYPDFVKKIHPEDMPVRNKAHEVALKTGNLLYESRIICDDNAIRWVRLNGRYLQKDAAEKILIGLVMDVTEEKKASEIMEQKIEERTMELKYVNDQLRQFTYAASHDLQEPLRKVGFFLDRLVNNLGPDMSAENASITNRIQNTIGRMRHLIDDLLSYSNTTMGMRASNDVDLSAIVKDVLDDMEVALAERDAKVEFGELPVLKGDHRQLRQLMHNLVSNAVKYHKKGESPLVRISARVVEGKDVPAFIPEEARVHAYHLISVQDNGIGFDPNDAARIFALFQRLHGKSEYEGTGVGLAIVQKVVENHQGFIWAESKPGAGATFHVLLPVNV